MRARDFISEVNAAGELEVDPDLIERFTDRGWEIDGEGRDQIVMSKPGSNTVLKIVGQGSEVRQDVVRRYVNFFRGHQRNPHFPRVGVDKTFRWKGKTYYVYTQERLWSLPGDEAVLDYLEQAMATVGRGNYPNYDQVPPGLTAQQVDSLVRAVDQLYGSGQADQYEYDLGNVANIMQRANGQLVIVDPLSDFMSESVISEGTEHYQGLDITIDQEDDEITVTAYAGGKELGHVLFVDSDGYLMPQDLEVEERFRGQGIAKTMYDYVKSKGYRIRRSGQQTDAGAGFWDKHKPGQNVWENFADGKKPGRKGLAKRMGVDCKQSVTKLRKIAKNSSGERARMAHWCANMKSGKNK